jgi:hypothetical protein
MKGLVSFLLAAGSAAALVGVANAQPAGGGPRAVLFDQPNFQGRSITIVEGAPDLSRWGFAARAMSARFEGDWTVCEAPDLDGRCASVSGDVADLAQLGLRRILSIGEGDADGDDERETAGNEQAPDTRFGGWNRSFDAPAPAEPAASTPVAEPPAVTQAATSQAAVASAPGAPGAPLQSASAAGPPAPASAPSAAPAVQGPTVQGDVGRSAVFFATPTRGGAEVAVDMQGPANQFCHDQGLGSAVYFDTDGHVLRDVLCRRS